MRGEHRCDLTKDAIQVEKITVAVDPGIVINPDQLKRQVEGGIVMGVSMTLLEEVRFDESGVTTSDWRGYPISRRMASGIVPRKLQSLPPFFAPVFFSSQKSDLPRKPMD